VNDTFPYNNIHVQKRISLSKLGDSAGGKNLKHDGTDF